MKIIIMSQYGGVLSIAANGWWLGEVGDLKAQSLKLVINFK